MSTAVERAAEVLHKRWLQWIEEGVIAGPSDFCRTHARDLADAGLLIDDAAARDLRIMDGGRND